jgi:hypothetical protein
MYPGFRTVAEEEGNAAAVKEMDERIAESVEHAQRFAACPRQGSEAFRGAREGGRASRWQYKQAWDKAIGAAATA